MPNSLPNRLYSCAQVRELDRVAIEQYGIPGSVLMKRAGRSAFAAACQCWPQNRHWLILCGSGNNAGDAYVFAALAAQQGHKVSLFYLSDPNTLSGAALAAYQYACQEGVQAIAFSADAGGCLADTVIVDGLLGTGIRGAVREDFAACIQWVNQQALPVISLDIPSGLCGDTGAELGCAVHADMTVTFIGCKQGLFSGRGPALTGTLVYDDLAVPAEVYDSVQGDTVERIQFVCCARLPKRSVDAHKGQFGHVMVIGGDLGFGGAAILAAEAAAFGGAGLVSLATRPEHVVAALVRRPEVMTLGVPSGQELEPHLSRPDHLVVGPGLGQSPWSEQMLQQALITGLPLVLDADALNILALGRIPWPGHGNLVITPHPGEAARLLNCSIGEVQSNRFDAVRRLQRLCGGVVVLKGAGTLIADSHQTCVALVGNPGLATAGSGDVLSGLIGSFMAQGLAPLSASKLAVCVHGEAGDVLAAKVGQSGLQAAELIAHVRELLHV